MSENKFENSGILHTNDRREKDTHPQYSGSMEVLCPQCKQASKFWLSAWVNDVKPGSKIPGTKYFSIKLKPKEAKPAAPADSTPPADKDDDIPF